MNANIRPEEPGDAVAIEAVTHRAFADSSYGLHGEPQIVAALREAGALRHSLVAVQRGAIVGHVALSPVQMSDGAHGWFGLGPLSVDPPWQRQGVGAQLVQTALRTLRADRACGCVLAGAPSYYGRFGFRPIDGLVCPGIPDAYFLAVSFSADFPAGVVSYHEAFAAGG